MGKIPRGLAVEGNGLRLHLLDWGDERDDREPVILLHGLQEHAHAWDFVAPRLAEAGLRVLALDARGHGDSEWIGRGGYYHFADYTADLAFVVRRLGGRAALVGHSMSGNVALTYAGTEPERVSAVISIEGLGPPDSPPDRAPTRYAGWVADLERAALRPRHEVTLDEATARLAERFPLWPASVARHMAEHGTREVGAGRPARTWKFDPLHRTRSPQPFYESQARAFWRRIACPATYVAGGRSFLSAAPGEIDRRVREIGARRVDLPHVGHHPHLEDPEACAEVLVASLAGQGPS